MMICPECVAAVAAYFGAAVGASAFVANWMVNYSAAKAIEERRKLVQEAQQQHDALSTEQRQELEAIIQRYR
jgi:cobalamin biosynthesis protein CobD/CbiB